MYFFAVRPSPLQLGLARLFLLLAGAHPSQPVSPLLLATVCLAGVGIMQIVGVLAQFGPPAGLLLGLLVVAALLAGAIAFLLPRRRELGSFDRSEVTGVLIGIGPTELCCTVVGATIICGWEHIDIYESALGFVFRLPWRSFHLLPRGALNPGELALLQPILASAQAIRRERRLALS